MNKYTIKINNYFVLSLLIIFSSCDNVAKFDSVAVNSDTNTESGDGSSNNSDVTFSGIDSIDNVKDTIATINWTHVVGANGYQIFSIINSTLTYIASVDSPTSTYNLTGLSPGETTTYMVRLVDLNGKNGADTQNVSVTTNLAPDLPSGLSLSDPSITPEFDSTPTISVSGVKSGDTVKLFTDSSCVNEVGSAVASGSSVLVTSSSIIPGTYSFYANVTLVGTSNCSTISVTYERMICPSGYISVPANAVVGVTNPFCVMKYEAKNDGSNNPVSNENDALWLNISQTTAWDECDSLNTEGNRSDIDNDINIDGTYALISNPEWMAIARNIENVASNWTNGVIGSGCIKRGNVGGTHACAGGDSGYGGPNPDSGAGRSDNGTAQLTLDNGEVIWDFSGNVWEWVDWTLGSPLSTNMSQVDKPCIDAEGPRSAWREFDVLDKFSVLAPTTAILPSDPTFNADQGVGRYYSNTSAGATHRGGGYFNIYAGVFALRFRYSSTNPSVTDFGFRCVYRVP